MTVHIHYIDWLSGPRGRPDVVQRHQENGAGDDVRVANLEVYAAYGRHPIELMTSPDKTVRPAVSEPLIPITD